MIHVKKMDISFYYRQSLYYINYFFYNDNNFNFFIKKIIKNLKLLPQKYRNRSDQQKLLPLKKEIMKLFESELLKFSKKEVLIKILPIISDKIFLKKQYNFYRYNIDGTSNLFYNVQKIEFEIKVLKFILEKRLALNDVNVRKKIKRKELIEIISLGSFVYKFQIVLDFMYYEMNLGSVEIDENYNLNIDFCQTNLNTKYLEETYDANDIILDDNILKEYIKCFKLDLGFDINDFTEVSSCLCLDIPTKNPFKLNNNIFIIKKSKLIELVYKKNQRNLSYDTINNILNYLILNKDEVVANYRREETVNRIDQKPILDYNGVLYYSPAMLSEIHRYFINAILIYDFPFKKDLKNINKLFEKIKKKAEKQIVYDTANVLKKYISGPIYVERKLHQINSLIGKSFSESIGDFDILAIDNMKKIIYNIEIKNLKLYSTIYEMYRQYHGFYDKNNYEIKFSRRIDALSENKKNIFPVCFNLNVDEYQIVNVFLTNKSFNPLFSKRKDIIYLSFNMFENYLKLKGNL
ncbi:MAG: hypothetical protein IJN13_03355 [Bacilli bacterium]|nr:hypothetical protein [Bacilli bacterium]